MSQVLLRLAARNLWRQRRRTLLTLSALAFGVLILLVMDSLFAGFDDLGSRNLIDFETGHLQIRHQDYGDDGTSLSMDHAFRDAYLDSVRSTAGVSAAVSRLTVFGQLHTGREEYYIQTVGVDPAADPQVFPLPEFNAGDWLTPGEFQMVMGGRAAELLDLSVGDYATVVMRTVTGAFQALDFQIVGLLHTPHPKVNRMTAYVPLDVLQSGLLAEGMVTEITVRSDNRDLQGLQTQLAALAADRGELEVSTWQQTAAAFLAIGESKAAVNGIFLMLIMLIALVGVVNTVLLGALERTREIGMLKAMGMREREVVGEFLYESFIIGAIGSLLGCALAVLFNAYFVQSGIDFGVLVGDMDIGYPISGVVFGVWNWPLVLVVFAVGTVVSTLAGVLPAVRAARRDPIWALRQ